MSPWWGYVTLVTITGTTIVTATHLKVREPKISSTDSQSSNALQWLDLVIGHQDRSPSNGHQGDMSIWQKSNHSQRKFIILMALHHTTPQWIKNLWQLTCQHPATMSYRKISNIRHTKSPNWNVSHLVLQLHLPNPMKPGVKSRMNMQLEQRRQAMLQLHLSDRQFYCLIRWVLY